MRRDVACVEVSSGDALLTRIQKEDGFSLIFLDLRMPEKDGFATLKELQAIESKTQCTKIIAYSVLASEADRGRALEAGFDAILTKPLSRSELSTLLTRYLGRVSVSDP